MEPALNNYHFLFVNPSIILTQIVLIKAEM